MYGIVVMHGLQLIENSFQQIRKDRNQETETTFLDPDLVENIPARTERHRVGHFSFCGAEHPDWGGSCAAVKRALEVGCADEIWLLT